MSSDLKSKAVKGIVWNLFERFGYYGIRFILGIILARLLTPKDYGLVGMIGVFFALAAVLIEGGFGNAYIQKSKTNNDDANTVFYINIFVSIFLYILLYLFAPAIANFYDQIQLVILTRVMAIVIVIDALNLIHIVKLKKAVNFKSKTKINLFSSIVSGLAGIISAYFGLGVWSLVVQQLVKRIVLTINLWLISKWRPSFVFSLNSFKSLFSFGSWMLLAGLIKKVFDNIYILTIGKIFSVIELGFYSKAKQFQRLITQQLGGAIGEVSFPIFSQIQDQKETLKKGMTKFLTHSLAIIAPLLVIFIVTAKPFTIILLTDKWSQMIPYLQLLCIIGIFYPIQLINVQVLVANGKSKLNFILDLIKGGLRIINILIMFRFGVLYIIIGEVIVSIISLFINTYYIKKIINYGLFKQLNDLKMILLGSIFAGAVGYYLNYLIANLWLSFMVGFITTSTIYISFQYFFNYQLFSDLKKLKNSFVKYK